MANFNTIYTAAQVIPCTDDELKELQTLLDADTIGHGFSIDDSAGPGAYLYAEVAGDHTELPDAFLIAFGKLIGATGLDYLEVGCAFTCSRLIPNSHGGTAFRILPDGFTDEPLVIWPRAPKIPIPEPPAQLESGWYQHYKGDLYSHNGEMTFDTLTQEWKVIYFMKETPEHPGWSCSRSYNSFIEEVDGVPRYQWVMPLHAKP